MTNFAGTGVAMVTPFNTDFSVDYTGLKKLTQHLINGQVDYLVILGTTGEPATLTAEERDQVISTVMAEATGKIPCVIGCGGNNTAEVCQQMKEWDAKFNPAGFLSVSPYYNKPSQEGIYQHYMAVCKSTPKPVILYNVPGRTSSNVLPSTILRIAENAPNAVAVKEASGNLEQGMEIFNRKSSGFQVISGDDILTIGMMAAGYEGLISVIANAYPNETRSMVSAGLGEHFNESRNFHFLLFNMMQLIFREGNPAGVKALLAELGICGPTVRLPLVSASESLVSAIAAEASRIQQQKA